MSDVSIRRVFYDLRLYVKCSSIGWILKQKTLNSLCLHTMWLASSQKTYTGAFNKQTHGSRSNTTGQKALAQLVCFTAHFITLFVLFISVPICLSASLHIPAFLLPVSTAIFLSNSHFFFPPAFPITRLHLSQIRLTVGPICTPSRQCQMTNKHICTCIYPLAGLESFAAKPITDSDTVFVASHIFTFRHMLRTTVVLHVNRLHPP